MFGDQYDDIIDPFAEDRTSPWVRKVDEATQAKSRDEQIDFMGNRLQRDLHIYDEYEHTQNEERAEIENMKDSFDGIETESGKHISKTNETNELESDFETESAGDDISKVDTENLEQTQGNVKQNQNGEEQGQEKTTAKKKKKKGKGKGKGKGDESENENEQEQKSVSASEKAGSKPIETEKKKKVISEVHRVRRVRQAKVIFSENKNQDTTANSIGQQQLTEGSNGIEGNDMDTAKGEEFVDPLSNPTRADGHNAVDNKEIVETESTGYYIPKTQVSAQESLVVENGRLVPDGEDAVIRLDRRDISGAEEQLQEDQINYLEICKDLKISVSEPIKVGDTLSAHTVYKVSTIQTNDSAMSGAQEIVVRRRYRDFEWLYQQLSQECNGIFIPAIPEKQSFGRFETEFISKRRKGLERFLIRISQHPVLKSQESFEVFLYSDNFYNEAKSIEENRKKKKRDSESVSSNPVPETGGGLGFLNYLIGKNSIIGIGGGGGGGSASGIGGGGSDSLGVGAGDLSISRLLIDKNDEFSDKISELEVLEAQLKTITKIVTNIGRHKDELSHCYSALAESYIQLAGAESGGGSTKTVDLAEALVELGTMHKRLDVLQQQQNSLIQDNFGTTIDEYRRFIASIKVRFAERVKLYSRYKSNSDSLAELKMGSRQSASISALELTTEQSLSAFEQYNATLRQELDRFESIKVAEFLTLTEDFLAKSVDIQDEIVGLWDQFVSRQL